MLANPMDDTTWDNSNSTYHGKLTTRYSHITEDKWRKAFGKLNAILLTVRKTRPPRWVVLSASPRKKV